MKVLTSSTPENSKQTLVTIQQHNRQLRLFGAKLEGYFSKFEVQTKYRAALHTKKQELLNALQELRKDLQTPKLKKFKDKVDLIDRLRESFEAEQKTRALTDVNKDRVVKDLAELAIIKK